MINLISGEIITSYAGDWESFIRIMPHSEYPSASFRISACQCKAFVNAIIEFRYYWWN